jgi:hypothetical protein
MGKNAGHTSDGLVDFGVVVLAVHNEMIYEGKQFRKPDMTTVGFDTGVDILLFQQRQKLFQSLKLQGHFTTGESDTATVKKHHAAGANLLRNIPDIQGFSTGKVQAFRIGTPGTPKIAALQMVHQPIARTVLGIVESFLKNADLHRITSFAAIISIIVKFVNFIDKSNGGFYNNR